jgi:hypothetical protein
METANLHHKKLKVIHNCLMISYTMCDFEVIKFNDYFE